LLKHALDESVRGSEIAKILKPDEDDYFVLKPKHSGFFSTTLNVLLEYLKVQTLILTGVTTDICILFTANDAYVRDFNLFIPSDCTVAVNKKDHLHTLKFAERVLKANTQLSTSINFDKLKS
jgi:nicotinamidase-related amidase